MSAISFDNGLNFVDSSCLSSFSDEVERFWPVIEIFLDEVICERVHNEYAPCSRVEFLARYLTFSDDLIIG